MELISLFFVSFLAATIFPFQSEALLATLHLSGDIKAGLLVIVATTGNVLGSCVNWLLGRYIEHFKHKRWFPANQKQLDRATRTYQKYGVWTLLLAWLPIIGDPLTIIAGLLRTNIVLFIILVTIGKAARYVALVGAL